jgi:hypothetical protein
MQISPSLFPNQKESEMTISGKHTQTGATKSYSYLKAKFPCASLSIHFLNVLNSDGIAKRILLFGTSWSQS